MNVDWSYWPCMTFFLVVRLGGGGCGDQYRKGLRRIQALFQKDSIYFAMHTLKQMWKRWLFSQWHRQLRRKSLSAPINIRCQTYDPGQGHSCIWPKQYMYVPLNRVWFSWSWVLNREYSFTIKHLEEGVFLDWKAFKEHGDLRWAVHTCNTHIFFPKYLFPRFYCEKLTKMYLQ